ncbi:MAG: 2-phosphosulfolactate phosphatase [Synergistaceae bacterium]|nr:2-phosphosulfolactate phosphatase [Synergistaceae bacterium]
MRRHIDMAGHYEADLVFSCGGGNYLPSADVWLVVDVLRATTVMSRWFELGGTELYPVKSPDDARKLVQELKGRGSSPLLMGEVNGIPPEGFDAGNSPVELSYELVRSHYCGVMSTTNGTVALLEAASTGCPVIAASFRNYSACLDYALTIGSRIGILCSGRKKRPSWEDALCAGAIVEELSSRGELIMSDSARMALTLWQNRGNNLREFVRLSTHARYLEQIGYTEDIAFSCEIDASTVVPMLSVSNGRTVLRSVSGSARPYQHEDTEPKPEPEVKAQKVTDPFEELLSYTRKKAN